MRNKVAIALLVVLLPSVVSCVNMEPAKDTLLAVSIAVGPLPAVNRNLYETKTDELIKEIKSSGGGYEDYKKRVRPMTIAFYGREAVLLALNSALRQSAQIIDDASKQSNAERKSALAMASVLVVRAAMDVFVAFSDGSALPAIEIPAPLRMAIQMLRTMIPSNWAQPEEPKPSSPDAGAVDAPKPAAPTGTKAPTKAI